MHMHVCVMLYCDVHVHVLYTCLCTYVTVVLADVNICNRNNKIYKFVWQPLSHAAAVVTTQSVVCFHLPWWRKLVASQWRSKPEELVIVIWRSDVWLKPNRWIPVCRHKGVCVGFYTYKRGLCGTVLGFSVVLGQRYSSNITQVCTYNA